MADRLEASLAGESSPSVEQHTTMDSVEEKVNSNKISFESISSKSSTSLESSAVNNGVSKMDEITSGMSTVQIEKTETTPQVNTTQSSTALEGGEPLDPIVSFLNVSLSLSWCFHLT